MLGRVCRSQSSGGGVKSLKFILFEYLASLGLSLERIHESRESLVNPGESEFMGSLTHIDPSAELPESSENDQFKCCGRGRISVHTRPNHSSPYPHPLQSRHACMQSFLTRDAILIWTSRQGFLRYGVELQNLRLSNSKYEEKLKSGVSGLPVYKVPRGVLESGGHMRRPSYKVSPRNTCQDTPWHFVHR